MLQERPDVTRSVIRELRGASPVEGLTIYRVNGVEAFTDLATLTQVLKNAELSQEVLDNVRGMQRAPGATDTSPHFQEAVRTLKTQESFEVRDGQSFFVVHQPVENQEKCQGCHGTDNRVRAVVRVASSMEPVFAEVRRQRNSQILIGLLTIENGLFSGAIAIAYGMPLIVEFGILFDILVAVIVMSLLVTLIQRELVTADTADLRRLRG